MSKSSRYICEMLREGDDHALTVDLRQLAAVSRTTPRTLTVVGKQGWIFDLVFDHFDTSIQAEIACRDAENNLIAEWKAALDHA